jgi:PIN domain nuclease of toxin-antitoxin system
VTVLIDTHALLWWIFDDRRISRQTQKILEDRESRRWVSYVSLWEIAIKMSLGKLSTNGLSIDEIAALLQKLDFSLLPVSLEHISRVVSLDHLHGDPFDRMLIAQAQELSVPLLTNDAKIKQYPVKTIW